MANWYGQVLHSSLFCPWGNSSVPGPRLTVRLLPQQGQTVLFLFLARKREGVTHEPPPSPQPQSRISFCWERDFPNKQNRVHFFFLFLSTYRVALLGGGWRNCRSLGRENKLQEVLVYVCMKQKNVRSSCKSIYVLFSAVITPRLLAFDA